MDKIIEYRKNDSWTATSCTKCGLGLLNRKAARSVHFADAELLFCPNCGMHIASIVANQSNKARIAKSA